MPKAAAPMHTPKGPKGAKIMLPISAPTDDPHQPHVTSATA